MADLSEEPVAPAAATEENLIEHVSAYPVPPLDYFARFFSDPVQDPDVGHGMPNGFCDENESDKTIKKPDFPAPPPVPSDHTIEVFGCLMTPTDHALRELEDQGIDKLGSDTASRKRQLKRLMWSVIAKFLEILDCLIVNPQADRRVELTTDLQTIFINLHHTVNQYRLPQAHDSLIELLKFQILGNIKQSEAVLKSMTSAVDLLQSSESTKQPNGVAVDGDVCNGPELEDLDVEMENLSESVECKPSTSANQFSHIIGELESLVASVRYRLENLSRTGTTEGNLHRFTE